MKTLNLLAAVGAALTIGAAGVASAQSPMQDEHPRVAEVNHRLAHQHRRIERALREGRIGPAKAARLEARERHMRHQERRFAARHEGRLSRFEQKRLNHEENRVSRTIG